MNTRFMLALLVFSILGCGERIVLPECSRDNSVEIREELGVTYHERLQDALQCSSETGRPVLILFDAYAQSNRACWDILGNSDVQALIRDRLVLCVLMVDKRKTLLPEDTIGFPRISRARIPTTIGQRNLLLEAEHFENTTQPLFALVNAAFLPLAEPMGYIPKKNPEVLIRWIETALATTS